MKNLYNTIINIGVKPNYQPWEIYLTRKLNSISLIGIFNLLSAIIFFILFDYTPFILICVGCFINQLIVILLNYFKNYIWASYFFYGYGFLFFFVPMIMKVGLDSYMALYYFPVSISMIMLLGKKER
jgi:type IV secretory pathway TraG/TraD family ATPase VirD4